MIIRPRRQNSELRARPSVGSDTGFTLLELVVVAGIVAVMTAISLPVIKSSLNAYRVNTAVASVTGAVQNTRYRAIQSGFPYRIIFTTANSTYQVQSDPTDTGAFANVGFAVPFSAATNILNANTTLTFRPGGAVNSPSALANGTIPMTVTYMNATPELITVSAYGRINVTP